MKRVPLAFALSAVVIGALFSQGAPAVDRPALVSVDELEQHMLDRLNTLRERRGLEPLRVSPALSSAAQNHTREMARNGFCGHDSAGGAPFWKRVSRFYRKGGNWKFWAVGENVLCYSRRLTAARTLRAWLASPGHRANLLSSQWREVGLAALYTDAAAGEFEGQDMLLVTADFGVRR